MEANHADCENLMKLLIYSVDKRSFYVIQQVVHTISYYWSLYLSNRIIHWPHSYLSAILPENLEFFSLKSKEFTEYYIETYADRPLSNPHTLNINNHLLPKSTLRKPCSLHRVVKQHEKLSIQMKSLEPERMKCTIQFKVRRDISWLKISPSIAKTCIPNGLRWTGHVVCGNQDLVRVLEEKSFLKQLITRKMDCNKL